ncbi:MAG: hypothetical protein HKN36_01535 [Hellea sp.]|nr:hypothetical protein [Hellea sp.]
MKLSFKPDPLLTGITIIMLGILISLGTWQYQRLKWKTALLDEIETAAISDPLTSLKGVQDALANKEPIDYRRIELSGMLSDFDNPLRVYQAHDGHIGWRLFMPFRQGDISVFGAFFVIEDNIKPNPIASREIDIAGYVRTARPDIKPRYESTPDENRWFGFNPMPDTDEWNDLVLGGADTRFYIDVVENETSAANLPIKRPKIRNSHFEYMLTWFSFALILSIIYFILHKKNGRLKWS